MKTIIFYKKTKSKKGKWIQETYQTTVSEFPTPESRTEFMQKYGFYKYNMI